MWIARQAARFALGLLGVFLLAAAVAAVPAHGHNYLTSVALHLRDFLEGDFGTSRMSGAAAAHELALRLPATLELMLAGALVAFASGIPFGLLLARGHIARAAAPLVQLVAAAPVFCAGLGLIWLSARVLDWRYVPQPLPWPALALGGSATLAALKALSLPGLTVGAAGAAAVQLAVRRSEADARGEPWHGSLRMMGLSSFEIDRVYVLPQVFAGVLANLGEIVLALFSAAAVAEWLFGWPGAAVLFLKSVALRDWSVTAIVILVFAGLSLIAEAAGTVAARLLGRMAS